MADPVPAFYWDSVVFISYINNIPDRAPHIGALLQLREAGKIRLYTSSLTVAEVAFAATEYAKRALSADEEKQIDRLLALADRISAHDLIMFDARAIMRNLLSRGLKVPRGADAVHLATALRLPGPIREFHTYDKNLIDLNGQIGGLVIREPGMPQPVHI